MKKFVCWTKIEEDTSSSSYWIEWIQLFKNPGLNHIGTEILLGLDDIEDIIACRLVAKDFQSIIDNPQFWFMKMEQKRFLRSTDLVLWKALLEIIQSRELMLEYNLTLIMMKMYRIRLIWHDVFKYRLNFTLRSLQNVLPAKHAKELRDIYYGFRYWFKKYFEAIPPELMDVLVKVSKWQIWKNPLKNTAMFGDHQLMKLMLEVGMRDFLIQGEDEAYGSRVRLWVPLSWPSCKQTDYEIHYCDGKCEMTKMFKSMVPHEVVFDRYTEDCNDISWTLLELAGLYHHWEVAKLLVPYVPIDRLNIHPNYRNVRNVTEMGYRNYQAYLQDSCLDKKLIVSICSFYEHSMQGKIIYPQN